MLNFDTGVFPPILEYIEKELHINKNELALLGINSILNKNNYFQNSI